MSDFNVVTNAKIDLPVMLGNLKKACSLWFLSEHTASEKLANKLYNSSYDNITTTSLEILRHGLRLTREDAVMSNGFSTVGKAGENNVSSNADSLRKFVDDFEWLCRSAQIRNSLAANFSVEQSTLSDPSFSVKHAVECFLRSWLQRNLNANCLSVCLQVLVAEKELLNAYYKKDAFLRNEAYSTALFICLSSVELNQYSLLSQIETKLYSVISAETAVSSISGSKHRRTTSHHIFSVSPPNNPSICKTEVVNKSENKMKKLRGFETKTYSQTSLSKPIVPALTTFRKIKSLPTLQHIPSVSFPLYYEQKPRPRSKTMINNMRTILNQDDKHPSIKLMTSFASFEGNTSNMTNDACFPNSNTTNYTTGSSYSVSEFVDLGQPSTSSENQQHTYFSNARMLSPEATISSCIEVINCDDIKIWTDQAYCQTENEQIGLQQEVPTTEPCAIPRTLESFKQKAKSSSPIGSFLCNLFSTPPTYTHWSILNQNGSSYGRNFDCTECNASSAVFPCTLMQPTDDLMSSTGGVFDVFKPVCGKKLRSRNSQSLFEDGISILDYKSPAQEDSKTVIEENGTVLTETTKRVPNCQQSLTDFLQASQMTRNNTDLEKENAHFRVSEAIISAIEHIKWDNNTNPGKKWRRRKEAIRLTPASTATDCLAGASTQKTRYHPKFENESPYDEPSEHIPYAELGESCLDLLSAEVVGLSLISKFDEKHLPKVSDLKWLVSEEDTPQQLLPMPDNSPTANPDKNVIRPMTRGTRYWAPPRQQIIFTDHPSTSRKELIQKQNNRCAGCGVRVSRQYINTFRYCTYLGKYHCTGCHRNQISPIPAKILQSWDFKCYPVSVFSYRLLEQMYTYPLFYVPDLNPALYVDYKALLSAREKRVHLKFVKDFIKTCRFAIREHVYYESIPKHITNDPDIWSLSDFIDVHNKSMERSIDQLIEKCEHHIFNCVLCTARGFHCEHCRKDQVIYPWQQKVFRCDRCGSCFHFSCWKLMSNMCCRCQRISKRKEIEVT